VKENSQDLGWYGFEGFVVDGIVILYNMKERSSFVQGIAVRKMRGVNHKKIIAPYVITEKGVVVYPDQPFIT
jgi:KaiC/GvpD/RAD55 family RecA-like ATPase